MYCTLEDPQLNDHLQALTSFYIVRSLLTRGRPDELITFRLSLHRLSIFLKQSTPQNQSSVKRSVACITELFHHVQRSILYLVCSMNAEVDLLVGIFCDIIIVFLQTLRNKLYV